MPIVSLKSTLSECGRAVMDSMRRIFSGAAYWVRTCFVVRWSAWL